MNNHFQPSGRKIERDQAIKCDLKEKNLKNHQFIRLVAMNKKFTKCDFSFSEFEASYLRNCNFDSCDFIGCSFSNTNLSGSQFSGCKFDYAQFSHTQIDPVILDSNCPSQENIQQIFARTLRVNYSQTGNTVAANKAIKVELEATRIHLLKAWHSPESYYRKKYSGSDRAKMFVEWLWFVALDIFWGNGESPLKLLRSLVFCMILIAFCEVFFLRDFNVLSSFTTAIFQSPEVLMGVTNPEGFSGLALALIASLRYIMFACFVSIVIKRLSRR